MENRETVEQVLERSACVAEVVAVDPRALPLLTKASREASYSERWYAYERLKQEATTIVGYEASQPTFRTASYYDAMIDAIDALLPQHEDDFVIFVPRTDELQSNDSSVSA